MRNGLWKWEKNRRNWSEIQAAGNSKHLHVSENATSVAFVGPSHSPKEICAVAFSSRHHGPPCESSLILMAEAWAQEGYPDWAATQANMCRTIQQAGPRNHGAAGSFAFQGFHSWTLIAVIRSDRMKLEAEPDEVLWSVVSHALLTWWVGQLPWALR